MSHWLYKNKILEEAPEGIFGFVYLITNIKTGKKYIGRKYFGKTRRIKKKGSKRRKVIRKDSDWRTYIGSSKLLQENIEKNKKHFKFEILAFGKTKGQVNYIEENLHHKLTEQFLNIAAMASIQNLNQMVASGLTLFQRTKEHNQKRNIEN